MDDPTRFPPDELEQAPSPGPDLNEPQQRAVLHVNGPLLIFAGAGSGKTRVIVYRIANLVACERIAPYRVLAVTFTNKAAGEMKHRLQGLLGEDVAKDLWVGTFHSVCVRLLRRYHEAAGLERNFVIYDDGDQKAVMNRVIKELDLDEKRFPPRQVLARIHANKQEGRGPADYPRESFVDDTIIKCFEAYERHLKSANAVDFDDLLIAVLRMLEDPESLAGQELRARFSHVLVDEFQDVNHVQYRLVRALAGDRRNLCVVGDDDQSIYRWRGADVRVIRGFRRDFPDATMVKLEQNYRSTANIVRGALGVIKPAEEREPKELWTNNPHGDPIQVIAADNEHDEAAFVAEKVKEAVSGGVSPRDIAIFYRIHAQSRVLEEVMLSEDIPYQIIGGVRFYERAEVKNLLAYLRVIANPRSDVDLERIINVPPRKIGDTTIERLRAEADKRGTSLFDAITPAIDTNAVTGQGRKGLIHFHELIDHLRAAARTERPSVIAEEVLEQTGMKKALKDDDSAESDARLENLEELVGSILDYEEEAKAAGEEPSLVGYLERVTLSSAVDDLAEQPRVAMMTVHAAKGLEFDTVFLTGMEEDLFPFKGMDPKRNEDTEEERRLAYVAVTRARRRLYISYASRRAIFGQTRYGLPSRFIGDLPPSAVRQGATLAAQQHRSIRQEQPSSMGSAQGSLFSRPRPAWSHPQERATREPARAPGERYVERTYGERYVERAPGERYVEREPEVTRSYDDASDSAPRAGGKVEHKTFGMGVVSSIDPGDDPIVTVKFSGYGVKRIKARFLRFL